jgi:chemotaxis protein CheX
MDVKYINPLLSAIVRVLDSAADVACRPGKPTVKRQTTALGDISGVLRMTNADTCGSVAISFSKSLILEIFHRMLMQKRQEIDVMVRDLTGELANMVTGAAKKMLEDDGYGFEMSLPQVIGGKDHEINHRVKGPTVLLPFNTEYGDLYVEICFDN